MTAPSLKRKALHAAAQKARHLTTSEAAALTGYTTDHIALLVRRGDLGGQRRGRDWFVDAVKLLEYVKKEPKPGPKAS
jgi:excisionase family DNA binding protein